MKVLQLLALLLLNTIFIYGQGTVLNVDFEHLPWGVYDEVQWKADWNNPPWNMGLDQMVRIVEEGGNGGKNIQVKYPKDRQCLSTYGDNGALWYTYFDQSYEELYLTFRFKFEDGFEWVKGGKFHGLKWGGFDAAGQVPDGTDGGYFTNMWRPNGELVFYVYHPDQATVWGDDLPYKNTDGTNFTAQSGRWYTVTNHLAMNTPGERNGIIQTWIDGELVLERTDMRFRDIGNIQIDEFDFSTFFGGCDDSWAPSSDQYMYFDDFSVATEIPDYLNTNSPPTFNVSGNITVNENFSTTEYVRVIPYPVSPGEEAQEVTYTLTPSSALFANISIDPATGLVTITSVSGASGRQIFMITADDGQSTNNTAEAGFFLDVQDNTGAGGSGIFVGINAGGETFTTSDGKVFLEDRYFTGTSNTYSVVQEISSTTEDTLYQTERSGQNFNYEIPLSNGIYNLSLHFAEIYWAADSIRVFDVNIEGENSISNYDIHKEVNAMTATVKKFSGIYVSDGSLSLNFQALQDLAKISAIEVFSTPVAFPIELKYFDAIPNPEKHVVDLLWTTSAELNNSFFTIERSIDGSIFEPLVRTSSYGNSVTDRSYQLVDLQPMEGVSYYRLKQTDIDGTFSYHQVVQVNYKPKETAYIKAYPVPVSQSMNLNIECFFSDPQTPELIITNVLGEPCWQQRLDMPKEQRFLRIKIPMHKFIPGLYIIHGLDKNEAFSQKILIRK